MIERASTSQAGRFRSGGKEGDIMGIQYQIDEQGNRVAVVIPLAEWEAIQERLASQPGGPLPIENFGMTSAEGGETRSRLEAFATDWDSPEMDAYDRYDEARKHIETR